MDQENPDSIYGSDFFAWFLYIHRFLIRDCLDILIAMDKKKLNKRFQDTLLKFFLKDYLGKSLLIHHNCTTANELDTKIEEIYGKGPISPIIPKYVLRIQGYLTEIIIHRGTDFLEHLLVDLFYGIGIASTHEGASTALQRITALLLLANYFHQAQVYQYYSITKLYNACVAQLNLPVLSQYLIEKNKLKWEVITS